MSPSPTPGPQWHTEAVFYEVPVKSYFDSSGDGVGDFRGLTQKLDYIQELGATCIWLLPFLASPHKDDGYDVTDFRAVHPAYGTLADFQTLLAEAHRRGLRVAADMAINHTSSQHPWFQAARQAPANSSLRQYYHWSESSDGFAEADVLFGDAKLSNWSWDAQAKAFYWHRFYDHEPDLNYDHAEVRREMLNVLRFWADLGVDALCLNGAAYLAEREGTRCEHLPETHALVAQFQAELSASYPDLVLEAGVNAWPGQAHAYFGDGAGGGCHLVPHLALAPRLFLALRQENAYPLVNLLEQTPAPPSGCQWTTLLRNHDELALRLATDEERDYLFQEYARDPSMRIHSGILRRLAPLLDNSQSRIELAFGLLFSLPGAPLVYYGDEIGMGDNVFLGGRTGVRTPMQWSPDRNAGFSTADFSRLFCPPVMDPVFGYQAVNVEAQLRDTSSQFHWIRRMIAARKSSPALSHGTMRTIPTGNNKVLAFVREANDETSSEKVLVVANLARTAQPAELELTEFRGLIPREIFGREAFKPIGAEPYSLTLAPHGIFWFRLVKSVERVALRRAPVVTEDVAVLPEVEVASLENLFDDGAREPLERQVLPGFLKSQRWFGGKARQVSAVRLRDWGDLPAASAKAYITLVEVEFAGGTRDLYLLPLGIVEGSEALQLHETRRSHVLARLLTPQGESLLFDALASEPIASAVLAAMGEGVS